MAQRHNGATRRASPAVRRGRAPQALRAWVGEAGAEPAAEARVWCEACDREVDDADPVHAYHPTSPIRREARAEREAGPRAVPITRAGSVVERRHSTGMAGLDRVLGGGLVDESVVLITGEPGIGKSTLLMGVAANLARRGLPVLNATGEETQGALGGRALRMGVGDAELLSVLETASVADVSREIRHASATRRDPLLVIFDSVQKFAVPGIDAPAGSVTQVRAVTDYAVDLAKKTGRTVVLVGQVLKDGDVAGPKTLEHMVDVVVRFGREAGDRRYVCTTKNRFGPAGELAVYEMRAQGLVEVADPFSDQFADLAGSAGVVAFPAAHMARVVVVPVEAMVSDATDSASRVMSPMGYPAERFRFIVDLLTQHKVVDLSKRSVRVRVPTVAEGAVTDPALDLAVAQAIVASAVGDARPVAAWGEFALSGRVLASTRADDRLAALGAHPVGVGRIVAPRRGLSAGVGHVRRVASIAELAHGGTPSE